MKITEKQNKIEEKAQQENEAPIAQLVFITFSLLNINNC